MAMEKMLQVLITIFSVTAIRYFILAGIPFLVFYKLIAKWYAKGKIQNRAASLSDFKREILQYLALKIA